MPEAIWQKDHKTFWKMAALREDIEGMLSQDNQATGGRRQ